MPVMRIASAALILMLSAAGAAAQSSIPAPPDVAAPPSDATKTASGLATKVLKAGTEKDHPAKEDLVQVHYTGWTTDGKMFDSSVARNKPSTFGVSRVIAGFSEGLQLMVVGEKRRLWIPEALAYKGQEGRPKGMFAVELQAPRAAPRCPSRAMKRPRPCLSLESVRHAR